MRGWKNSGGAARGKRGDLYSRPEKRRLRLSGSLALSGFRRRLARNRFCSARRRKHLSTTSAIDVADARRSRTSSLVAVFAGLSGSVDERRAGKLHAEKIETGAACAGRDQGRASGRRLRRKEDGRPAVFKRGPATVVGDLVAARVCGAECPVDRRRRRTGETSPRAPDCDKRSEAVVPREAARL